MPINRWIRISTMTVVTSCLLFVCAFAQQNTEQSNGQISMSHSFPECLAAGTTVKSALAIFDSQLAHQQNSRLRIKDGNNIIFDELIQQSGAQSASQFIELTIQDDTELMIEYLDSNAEILFAESVLINALHTPTVSLNHVSCLGEGDGSISIQSSPLSTYLWSTGETTSDISNLTPGLYSVSIENENKCFQELDFVIDNASQHTVDFRKLSIRCNAREESLLISNMNSASGIEFDWHSDGQGDWDDTAMISMVNNSVQTLDTRDPSGCIASHTIDPRTLDQIDFGASPVTIFSGDKINDSWYIFDLRKALSPAHGDLDNDGAEGSVFQISYHNSFIEAELGINEINSEYYSEPKSIFARVQSPLSCYDIAEITLSAAIPVDVRLNLEQHTICEHETGLILKGGTPTGGIYRLAACDADEECPQDAISYFNSIEEFVFDPTQVKEGSYTIEYSVTDENDNEFVAQDIIEVQGFNFDFFPEDFIICSGSDPIEIASVPNGQDITGQGITTKSIDIAGEEKDVFFFDPSGLQSGTYEINSSYVTNLKADNYTCNGLKSKTVNVVDIPTVTMSPSKSELCAGEQLTFTCTVTNGGPQPSYHWFGPHNFESREEHFTIDDIGPEQSGMYYLEVENGHGCVVQESVDISVRKKIDIGIVELKPVSCFGQSDAIIKVTKTDPSYTYEWDNGTNNARAIRLAAGMHQVTVTDDLACTATASIGLFEPEELKAEISVTEEIACHGAATAKARVVPSGGTGSYAVEWSHGDVTLDASQLSKGTYTVTVTDENSCVIEKELVLEEPDNLTIDVMSIQHLTCFAADNGQAVIDIQGGIAPYTSEWSNGESGAQASALTGGEQRVVVTDAVGCSTTMKIQLDEPSETLITVENTEPHLCGLAASGTARLAITGPSTYSAKWDNGETGMTANQLTDGLHYATVTDLSGCTLVKEVTIDLVTNMLCQSQELSPATCQNAVDGRAIAQVSSGSTITSYTWDNGEQTQVASALSPGIHTVTVTDDNDCQIICSVTIAVAAPIQIACNNSVNLSLAGNCQLNFKPDLVVENFTRDFNYTLTLKDEFDNLVDTLDIKDYVGQTLDYVITETCQLSSCWGSINLEDKLGPQLNCATQTIDCIAHMNEMNVSALPLYDATDFWYTDGGEIEARLPTDCSLITMSYSDDMVEKDCDNPFSHIVERKWYAVDEYNNESKCTQQINIYREDHQVVWPYDTSHVYCMTEDIDTETTAALSPEYFGWPTLLGMDSIQALHPSPCLTFDYVFSDHLIKVCSGSFKVLREWVAIQACDGRRESYTQTIYLKTIDFDPVQRDTTVFIESGFDCNTDMYLPIKAPQYCGKIASYSARIYGEIDMEDCQVYTEKSVTNSLVLTDDGKLTIPDLELGCNYIEVYLTTDCYETDTLSFYTTVADYQAPVLICDAQTVVSLGSDGRGHLTVNNVDNGSWDNCGIAHISLTKQDSICAVDSLERAPDIVSFCCEESGTTVVIIMEAEDYNHNKSSCQIEVYVEDGVMPYIECPQHVLLPCTEDLYDLELTGKPWADIKCSPVDFYHIDSTEIGQCRNEKVERHWYSVFGRDSSFVCTQSIQLFNEFAITDENIVWPEDIEIEQCSGDLSELSLAEPIVDTLGGCELIATNFIDREFETSLGSCLSILREWTIIDWCQYNENDKGIWRNSQVIKIHDKVKPEINCEDIQVCVLDRSCEGELDLTMLATDDCSAIENLSFQYELDLNGDGLTDQQHPDQTHQLMLNLPIGNHKLTVYTTDQCGNTNHCQSLIDVSDCKAPTPYCIAQTVSTIFNDDDVVEVWATDFNLASRDNCTADEKLQFSFEKDTIINVAHFRCEDIIANGSERFDLSIWVSDEAGNQDACHVSIKIDQRENYPCDSIDIGSAFNISGLVTDVNDQPLADYTVTVENAFAPDQTVDMNSLEGHFEMPNAQRDSYYEIELSKDDEFITGVTTIDMITLQNHLIGVREIVDEHKLIAADINRDGRLSSADLLLMKRLIIGQITSFPEYETPWIFKLIDADKFIQISDSKFVTEDIFQDVHMDVVALKIGDIDGSAQSLVGTAEQRGFVFSGDFTTDFEASIFPNPILGQATLSLTISLENHPVDLTILDNEGKLIVNERLSILPGDHSMDISNHFQNEHAGLFYVIVHQAGVMKTLKVVKL